MKLLYFEKYKIIPLPIQCICSASKFVFRLYEYDRIHFLDIKLTSTLILSIEFSEIYSFNVLHEIPSHT